MLDWRKVEIVKDEDICQRAAKAYGAWHLREVPGWQVKPVLVVRVGSLYLVDDQRDRRGRSAFWAVLVYGPDFKERHGHFGAGY